MAPWHIAVIVLLALWHWLGGWLMYMHVVQVDIEAVKAGRRDVTPKPVRYAMAAVWPAVALWLVFRIPAHRRG